VGSSKTIGRPASGGVSPGARVEPARGGGEPKSARRFRGRGLAWRSLRWAGNASAAVLVVGSLGACCGAIPLATILAGAGAAGLLGGFGALAATLASAAVVTLAASLRRRASGADCCSPASLLTLGLAGVAAAALIALVALAASRSGTGAATGGGGSGSGSGSGRAARLDVESLDGRRITVPRRGTPGALFFTVSSCISCIPSAQALSALNERLGGKAEVTMVDIDPSDPPDYLRAWGSEVGDPSYPLTIDTSGSAVRAYDIKALGTTVIYDARGRIVARMIEPGMAELQAGFAKAGAS